MKSYPKLRYPGDQETYGLFSEGTVYIQEKVDGSNFRFALDGDELRFGSKNTEGEGLARDQFANAIEYVEDVVDVEAIRSIESDRGPLIFFGEAMNPHTISYDWENTPEVIGFDIWSVDDEGWLHPDDTSGIFDTLGLPVAPIVDDVPADQWDVYDFEVPQSAYYDGPAEGVVFKNPMAGVYGKYVRDDFKEKNKEKFGAPNKNELTDTELFVEEYVPPARVRSVAFQLVDDGEWDSLKMDMMVDLPEAVIRDMADEEGGNIFMGESKEIDIGEFRSIVSGRSAGVLRQMIDEQARGVMDDTE